ncbi:MAG: FtsX-like permease family protein, partial [Bacteroidota bacterium]
VDKVSLSNALPLSVVTSATTIEVGGYPARYRSSMKFIDSDYLNLFEMPLLAGEPLLETDSISSIIVNREWIKMLGLDNPWDAVGLIITVWGEKVPIKGVIDNFHSSSMRSKITPMMLVSYPDYDVVSVKLATNNLSKSIEDLKAAWKSIYPEYIYSYNFVDERLANMYVKEEKMFGITLFFSLITIFIACIGLFGLASFMVNRKVKEVGVRKVLGASVGQIVSIFTNEFLRLILISFVIAAPLVWYGMDLWLTGFEYRVSIDFTVFITGIVLIIIISLATVIAPTVKASLVNPADSLRNE